ncbi:translation initiation factor IF-2-like [Macrosteles quadrilineatus]|uniref:translation initiation factor IF-2-like n=1 Tax=Macrosteles quadrilineatus TaxID=74068 RepID=UPI0023E1CE61|nr:translation initiation factor IF-2-like [Macrosteles quadrilineatus]
MKVILVLSAVLASALAAPPADPAAPARPSARLILLPARQQNPPPAEAAIPSPTTAPAARRDSNNAQTEKPDVQSEKLLDAGEYYVLTPEGKLQMVKYTTAALRSPAQPAQPAQVKQQPEPFAQFQVEYLQYPTFEFQPSPAQVKAEEEEEEAAGYEAKVEFRDVKPIPAPIYAYNPAPVVRILRK